MKNVLYYQNILRLGGTSTYEYELIKKYHKKKDIVLYYKTGDKEQIERLSKLCPVIHWNGETVECDAFFTNYEFNDDVLKAFKARKYYQVIHAQFITNKWKPKLSNKFTAYVCVSEKVREEFQALTDLPDHKLMVSHNPLTITEEEAKPRLLIGFFTRLSWEKGLYQMKELISRLDAEKVNYLCLIYTNDSCNIRSDNVILHSAIVQNTRSIMATMDIVGQLSLCEGDNYTTKEAKMCGCKMLVTDLETFKENRIIGKDDIVLKYDLSNIDEVVQKIKRLAEAKASRLSKWKPIEDKYDKLLVNGKSKYKFKDKKRRTGMKVKLMVTTPRGITFKELDGKFFRKGTVVEIEETTAEEVVKCNEGYIIDDETMAPTVEDKTETTVKTEAVGEVKKETPKKKPAKKKK